MAGSSPTSAGVGEEHELDEALVLKEGDTVSGLPGPEWVLAAGTGTGLGFGSLSFLVETPVPLKTAQSSRFLLYCSAR